MSLHLHCPLCGELLAEDQSMVITSTREGTRQETYDLACRCGTRLRLQLPPERWSPPRRRRRGRGRALARQTAPRVEVLPVAEEKAGPPPSAERPFPFTQWEYARLLLLRGRVQDGEMREGEESEEIADGGAPSA